MQENQRYWFKRQLELAAEASLPVIIHSRDAAQDTMEIMTEAAKKEYPRCDTLLFLFTGDGTGVCKAGDIISELEVS